MKIFAMICIYETHWQTWLGRNQQEKKLLCSVKGGKLKWNFSHIQLSFQWYKNFRLLAFFNCCIVLSSVQVLTFTTTTFFGKRNMIKERKSFRGNLLDNLWHYFLLLHFIINFFFLIFILSSLLPGFLTFLEQRKKTPVRKFLVGKKRHDSKLKNGREKRCGFFAANLLITWNPTSLKS